MKRLTYVLALTLFFISHLSQTLAQSNQTVTNGNLTASANFPGAGCSYTWVNNNPAIGLPASGTGNIQAFTATNPGDVPITATITATPTAAGFAYVLSTIKRLSIVDLSTNQIISNSETAYQAFGETISPDGNFLYVTVPSDNAVLTIDAATSAVVSFTGTGNNSYPRGITISPDGSKLYVTNEHPFDVLGHGTVNIISTKTHNISATINVGISPLGVIVSPDGSTLYVANQGSNFISVINANTGVSVGQIPINAGANTFAITHDGSQLYVTANSGSSVFVINTSTNQVIKNISVGMNPVSIIVSPDDKYIYVVNEDSQSVSVIDHQTKTVISTIDLPGGQAPFSISLSPDGTKAYVVNQNGVISVINTSDNSVTNSINTVIGALSFGNFVSAGLGCSSSPITFTITVKPTAKAPLIMAGPQSGSISACVGSPSVSPYITKFIATGSNLTAAVTIAAPNGFEVSLAQGDSYSNRLTLAPSGGSLNQPVYVRSAVANSAGDISGNIIMSSAGAANQSVVVTGIVNALPNVNTVPNQVKNNGTLSDLVTFTGTGSTYTWVNDHPEIGLTAKGNGNIPAFATVNNTSNPLIATITATPSNPAYAYITNSASSSVSVINVATNKIVATIPMGADPQDITISHDGKRVYVSDPISRTVSVIGTATNTVTANIPVPIGSFSMVVSPDNSKLYLVAVNSVLGKDDIFIINTNTNMITSTLHVGVNIGIIALSPDGSTLYATDNTQNNLLVLNSSDGQLLKTIAVGTAPQGVLISSDGSTAYVCNSGSNTVSVVSTATNTVVKTVTVGTSPFTLALSADGKILYVSGYSDGSLTAVNTSSNTVLFKVDAGQYPMGVSVTPDGTLVYVANSNSGTVTAIDALSGVKQETIPVGLNPFSIGSFITPVISCPGQPITFTITIKPTIASAVIKISGNIDPLTTVYGSPSSASSFTVSAANLTTGIAITPPRGFEISTDGAAFSQTITIGTIGTLTPTKIYIRLSATTPVGNYTGNILLRTDNTADQVIATSSINTVRPASLTIKADNKTKYYGEQNPVLTLTYNGFVNMETASVLSPIPSVLTTATSDSPAGQYPITVGGAGSLNYTITYLPGILTIGLINEVLVIPNTFTPNGDGINDRWEIKYIENFPGCIVNLYNRYGQRILTSNGYGIPWDGKYQGKDVSAGVYYYVIDTKIGGKPLSGWVAVLR